MAGWIEAASVIAETASAIEDVGVIVQMICEDRKQALRRREVEVVTERGVGADTQE